LGPKAGGSLTLTIKLEKQRRWKNGRKRGNGEKKTRRVSWCFGLARLPQWRDYGRVSLAEVSNQVPAGGGKKKGGEDAGHILSEASVERQKG